MVAEVPVLVPVSTERVVARTTSVTPEEPVSVRTEHLLPVVALEQV
jgi:hypothetical protein